MRKLLLVMILIVSMSSCVYANVEQDSELHKIIGGLYSVAAAVDMNENVKPDINQLGKFFTNTPKNMQLYRVKNSIWAGIEVGKTSTARSYLRSHAAELGILESPEGREWMSGDYAWMKIADVVKNKLVPMKFSASEGDGKIFFNVPGQNSWWMANPDFTAQAAREILNRHGVNQPDLHAPTKSGRVSIYDSVKPAEVGKPEKMHVGRKRSSFDMELEIGDIRFDPIPNRPRN
ncbi:MAG: hypothetical protein IJU48_05950 [Synergistaceae bacterium]|nr:hypothetical protein [Synergistaceae bacterium]